MGLTEQLRAALAANEPHNSLSGALADAERMSDQFSDVQPTPYIVPIERYVGMVSAYDIGAAR